MKRGTNYFKAHQNMALYDSNSIYIITLSVYMKSSAVNITYILN